VSALIDHNYTIEDNKVLEALQNEFSPAPDSIGRDWLACAYSQYVVGEALRVGSVTKRRVITKKPTEFYMRGDGNEKRVA
jgi:hypothetical protein